jgi:hypothetical protein
VDAGPVVAQVGCELEEGMSIEVMRAGSFLQKLYLSLVLVELFHTREIMMQPQNAGFTLSRDPGLQAPALREAFAVMERASTSPPPAPVERRSRHDRSALPDRAV